VGALAASGVTPTHGLTRPKLQALLHPEIGQNPPRARHADPSRWLSRRGRPSPSTIGSSTTLIRFRARQPASRALHSIGARSAVGALERETTTTTRALGRSVTPGRWVRGRGSLRAADPAGRQRGGHWTGRPPVGRWIRTHIQTRASRSTGFVRCGWMDGSPISSHLISPPAHAIRRGRAYVRSFLRRLHGTRGTAPPTGRTSQGFTPGERIDIGNGDRRHLQALAGRAGYRPVDRSSRER
jgi:hypothetical protein